MRRTGQSTVAVKILHPSIIHHEAQTILHLSNALPRSRLYGLVPCEVGTVWGESLTSYLNRLGWRHGISPRTLVAQEIVPFLDSDHWLDSSLDSIGKFSCGLAMSLNGMGSFAKHWSTILERLTTRADLYQLTLRSWVGDLQSHRSLREKPVWCSTCYTEWKDKHLPIYQPLIWMLQSVTICTKHNQRLEDHCPHCKKQQSVIAGKTLPGYCTQCATWLGTVDRGGTTDKITDETVNWQKWVLRALDELRSVDISSSIVRWERFFANLVACIQAKGTFTQLAKLTGVPRQVLYRWFTSTDRYTPSLETIFEFCYACGVTPLQVMANDLISLERALQDGVPHQTPRSHRSFHLLNREQCLELMQAVLNGQEELLSLRQIALRLGHGASTLRYHFPQECALITQQAQEYRRQRGERHIVQLCNEVRQIVVALHAQGIYPSHSRVRMLLSKPTFMRVPEVQEAWREARRNLGLDSKL